MRFKEVAIEGLNNISVKKYAILLLEYLMVLFYVNNFLLWLNNDLNITGGLIALFTFLIILFVFDPIARGALMHNAANKSSLNDSVKQAKLKHGLIVKTFFFMMLFELPNYFINMLVYAFVPQPLVIALIILIDSGFGIPQYLIYPSVVIKNLSPIKAFKNSIKLISNNKGLVLKTYLLTSFLTLVISTLTVGGFNTQPTIIGFTNTFISILLIRTFVTSFIDLFNINMRSIITSNS
jgi:hypothetical protein